LNDNLRSGIRRVLDDLSVDDTRHVYAAIQAARPGGLGQAVEADVNAAEPPQLRLKEVMHLAADRDLIARQYADGFAEVFWTADRLAEAARSRPLSGAIVWAYLQLMAEHPDTLVARKCGPEFARTMAAQAASVLAARSQGEDGYQNALAEFDFWLRADSHRRNPGTSADIIAAALFVLLREQRIRWPMRFY
jgi:triphosphoribosyl-dephospho-CoA synthase